MLLASCPISELLVSGDGGVVGQWLVVPEDPRRFRKAMEVPRSNDPSLKISVLES